MNGVIVTCANPTCAHRYEMHTMWANEIRQVLENQGWLIEGREAWCPRCRRNDMHVT